MNRLTETLEEKEARRLRTKRAKGEITETRCSPIPMHPAKTDG